jgi:hypothetical protein
MIKNLKRRRDLESPDSEIIIFDRPPKNTSDVDRIIGLYRPFTGPDGDKSSGGAWNRFSHLLDVINIALEGCHRATIVGDLNVDLLKDVESQGRYAAALKTLSEENSLEQLIHQPTRIQTVKSADRWQIQESLLDHVYSSDYRGVHQCGSLHLSHSDHMAIYIQYANFEQKSTSKKIIYKRDHRQYSPSAMAALCSKEDWGSVFNESDVQKSYNILEYKVKKIIDIVAPLRKVIISEKHPISNHALRSLENRRQTLYKRMKKRKSDKSIEFLKNVCLKLCLIVLAMLYHLLFNMAFEEIIAPLLLL